MKVAMVVPGGLDARNEAAVIPYLQWLVERLARRHSLHVYAVHRDLRRESFAFAGATVQALGRPFTELRAVAAIVAEQRRAPFDLIHALWAHWPGTVGAVASRLIQRPLLVHLAGGELVALRDIGYGAAIRWRSRMAVRFALRSAARVTVASGLMREQAAAVGCAATELPLGVDLTRWPVRAPRPRDPGRPARLLHVGTLNEVKDQGTLLEAAARLKQRGVPFRLDVVGIDILHGTMQALAQRLGLSDHVVFHGYLLHRDLRPLAEQADVLLVSSRHEAGPVAMLEAAVAGVPTVGTAVGHVRDWAPDAAVAVDVRDAAALARETEALLEDDERRMRLAQCAQHRAVTRDADWTAAAIGRLYGAVAGTSARRDRL